MEKHELGPLRRSERLRKKTNSKQLSKSSNCPSKLSSELSTESLRQRLRTEAELKKKKLEEEMLLQRQKLQQEIIELDLQLQLSTVKENTENEVRSLKSVERVESVGSVESEAYYSQRSNVKKWIIKSRGSQYDSQSNFRRESGDNSRDYRHSPLASTPQVPKRNYKEEQVVSQKEISRILTRQSLPKHLPTFDGNPIEWPNFISQYVNSTRICGYTDEENQCRLQKCLIGPARNTVQSLLIMPQNVNKVIDTLKRRFGQPEHIILLLIDKVKKLSSVREDKLESLIDFSDEVKNFVATIESLEENDHLRNPILLQELISKLPTCYKMAWMEYLSTIEKPEFKLIEFQQFLDRKAEAACQLELPRLADKLKFKNRTLTTRVSQMDDCNKSKTCDLCKQEIHNLTKCEKFKNLSVSEKWKYVISKKVCFSCLLPFHNVKNCRKRKSCGVEGCQKPHHHLLHGKVSPESREKQIEVNNCHMSTNKVFLKIVPVVLKNGSETINTYALLDDASTVSLIDENLARRLRLNGPSTPLKLQWTGNEVKEQEDSKTVSCTIRGSSCSKEFQLRHIRTIRNLSLPTQSVNPQDFSKQYPYLHLNKIVALENAKPLLLIGQDNWPLIVNRKLMGGPWKGPALSKTLLGWVIHGNVNSKNYPSIDTVCFISDKRKDDLDMLHELVKEQWKIDTHGTNSSNSQGMSQDDIKAQRILDATMKRKGMKIETGLLWKYNIISFPENKSNALKRLRHVERKMDKDPLYADEYCKKMGDLVNKNYVRKLSKDEAKCLPENRIWYLPHFGVMNPNKGKLRIVFDASAKSNGRCLNDYLLTGPDLYNCLYQILLNFRIKLIAFTADIKEMFLQVLVRDEDRRVQRFLWRGKDRSREPDVYELKVVFFGSTSGPCLAQAAKNMNATEFTSQYPEAVKAILQDHYMDDYLGGADSKEEAVKLINDVVFIHKQGGFYICNWNSNSTEVLEHIKQIDTALVPTNETIKNVNINDSNERILGLWWNPKNDEFTFQTKFYKVDSEILNGIRRPTKREALKVVMSVFDPLGFLGHFLIQGKIILQDIWRSQLGWDDEITDTLNKKWQIWLRDLKNISNFKIPRQYCTFDRHESLIQLHVFCDASELAYACVCYLLWQHENRKEVVFLTAKTRVTSLKPISIPRLELQATLMGARLGNWLEKSLDLNISRIIYWTDSKTVLHWLRSEARRYKVFVAHRVGEIQELTNISDWRYVPSKENVADEATKRTGDMSFLVNDSRWYKGPSFLREEEKDWPVDNTSTFFEGEERDLEKRNEFILVNVQLHEDPVIPDLKHISKWNRLLRSTAWMFRFVNKCRKQDENQYNDELEPEEIKVAEKQIFRKVQADSFPEEIKKLYINEDLPKSSRLQDLNCFMDDDGLIRLTGRLKNAETLGEFVKQPIVLDPKHYITKLLIRHYHEENNHQGQETVINELKQKYWILRIRQAVRKSSKSCQLCKNRKSTPKIPIMGQLPACRIEKTIRAFIKTGIDYFGPIEVTVKRSHEKRYGVILPVW